MIKYILTGCSSSVERSDGVREAAGPIPVTPTENESAKLSLDWLCAGGVAQSSAKPFLYETVSCRLVKKKFEPTVFRASDEGGADKMARVARLPIRLEASSDFSI